MFSLVAEDPDGDPLTYQWYDASDDTPVPGATQASLTLPVGESLDGNQYYCIVDDGVEEDDSDMKLIATINEASGSDFTFDAIPQTYSYLIVQGEIRAVQNLSTVYLRLHLNDISAGTRTVISYAQDTASGGSVFTDSTIISISAGGSPANDYSPVRMDFPNYTGSSNKGVTCVGGHSVLTTSTLAGNSFYRSAVTDPITKIHFEDAGNPGVGLVGTLRLYGVV